MEVTCDLIFMEVLILLESLFTQDDQIWKRKLDEELSLRKFQNIQKVNIGTQ
jgi:hypothetical protein